MLELALRASLPALQFFLGNRHITLRGGGGQRRRVDCDLIAPGGSSKFVQARLRQFHKQPV